MQRISGEAAGRVGGWQSSKSVMPGTVEQRNFHGRGKGGERQRSMQGTGEQRYLHSGEKGGERQRCVRGTGEQNYFEVQGIDIDVWEIRKLLIITP